MSAGASRAPRSSSVTCEVRPPPQLLPPAVLNFNLPVDQSTSRSGRGAAALEGQAIIPLTKDEFKAFCCPSPATCVAMSATSGLLAYLLVKNWASRRIPRGTPCTAHAMLAPRTNNCSMLECSICRCEIESESNIFPPVQPSNHWTTRRLYIYIKPYAYVYIHILYVHIHICILYIHVNKVCISVYIYVYI